MKAKLRALFSLAVRFVAVRMFKPVLIALSRRAPIFAIASRDAAFAVESEQLHRPPDRVLERYDNDEIGGYAIKTVNDDDELLRTQEGYIIPDIDKILRLEKIQKVVEVGVASGLTIEYLAKRHKDIQFTGIDFSVSHAAQRTADLPNVSMVRGYANDKIDEIDLDNALIFASSTLTIFLPEELRIFLNKCFNNGVTWVAINEPVWFQFRIDRNATKGRSAHMEYICWWHQYPGYLREAGFNVDSLRRRKVGEKPPFLYDRYAYIITARRSA